MLTARSPGVPPERQSSKGVFVKAFSLPGAFVLLSALALAGCPSTVDRRAQAGIDALARCDMRTAASEFEQAQQIDPTRSDIALAYALTDLAILLEDPALTALAPRLGFDRPIDTSLLWGEDGVLDRLQGSRRCDDIESLIEDRFPHPSARPDGPNFIDTIDPSLTLGDLRAALVAISPRLERIASALEIAANDMSEGGVTFEVGCVAADPMRVQAPELLALAAGLEAVRAATQIALAYDGDIQVALFLSSNDRPAEWVTMMNDHMLRLRDASPLTQARSMLARPISLARRAVAAARQITTPTADAIFDWTRMSDVVYGDIDAFAMAAEIGLGADGAVRIPRMTPALSIDIGSFFTRPFDLGSNGPLWSAHEDEFGGYTTFDGDGAERLLASRFDQDPWAFDAPSRSFDIDWTFENDVFGETFNPRERWSRDFSCE
jgi:hypothetical protein